MNHRALFVIAIIAILPAHATGKPQKKSPPPVKPEMDDKPPVITHVHVTRAPVGEAITIRARLADESEIFAPSVYARSEGQSEFENFGMKHIGDGWEATIPAHMAKTNVEYFLEAFDDQGNGPAREGSPEHPIKIAIFDPAKAARDPIQLGVVANGQETDITGDRRGLGLRASASDDDGLLSKWWFWTLIGVVVTAGVVTTVVVLNSNQKIDRVDVMVVGPDPAKGL